MDNCQQNTASIAVEQEDILGPNFTAYTLTPKQGQICTLIKHQHQTANVDPIAVLYLHGYTDYFYQVELAEFVSQQGMIFYALDLHGYGRSIRPFQQDHNQNTFSNYFADIETSLQAMANQGIQRCIFLGHSTGGLIVSRYLAEHNSNRIADIDIVGLILNSPFLSLPLSLTSESWRLPLYQFISRSLSGISLPAHKPTLYAQSIHQSLAGEWPYRLDWKPSQGSPLSFSWLNQIMKEQKACLSQRCGIPTLLCRSSKSTYHEKELVELQQGDGVLDVENMESKAKQIFTQLEIAIIDGGYHDLALSPLISRQNYYKKIQNWLSTY